MKVLISPVEAHTGTSKLFTLGPATYFSRGPEIYKLNALSVPCGSAFVNDHVVEGTAPPTP